MATLTRADISAAFTMLIAGPLAVQFRRDSVLLNLLTVRSGAGSVLDWSPKFEGRTAGGAYAEGADMADADYDSDTKKKAVLNWASYRTGAKISGMALSVAASGGQDEMGEELRDAIDVLAMHLATDLYGGDPDAAPTQLAGAAIAIDSDTGVSFAGLDPTTYPEWIGNEDSLDASQLSVSKLRTQLFRPIKDASGRHPDFVTCEGALYDLVVDLAGERAETIQEIRVARGVINIHAAMGARAVSIDGVPFVEDRHATAGTFYGWSSRDVEIQQLPAATPRIPQAGQQASGPNPARVAEAIKMLTGVTIEVPEVEARLRALRRGGALVPTVEFLAQIGDAYPAMVKAYTQLKWRRRNSHGKLVVTGL